MKNCDPFSPAPKFCFQILRYQLKFSKQRPGVTFVRALASTIYIPGDILVLSLEISSGNQTEPNLSIGSTEIFLVVLKPNQLGESDSTSIST